MTKNENKKTGALAFLLSLGLLLSTIGLVYTLEPLTNLTLPITSFPIGLEVREKTGELMVNARLLMKQYSPWPREDTNDLQQRSVPLPQIPLRITKEEPPNYNETLHTTTDGSLQVRLPVGEYLVESEDPRFTLSAKLKIVDGEATHLRILVARNSYPATFYEIFDKDSSGILQEKERLFVTVPTLGLAANFSDNVLIEIVRNADNWQQDTASFQNLEEIQARIFSSEQKIGYVYLGLQPADDFLIEGISILRIVTYEPSFEVFTVDF